MTGDTVVMDLEGVACGYGGRVVLDNIHLSVRQGDFLCLLGPNGIGKTTLFKTILRLLPAKAGIIRVHGRDIARLSAAELAAAIGYVPQAHTPPFPFSVLDVVSMGRAAHLGPFAQPSRRDLDIAEAALSSLAIGHLAARTYTEISGGERQLALIARALAQHPRLLVMDEPTSNLDFGNQIAVLDHIRALAERTGIAIVMTCHDPNHALRYANRVACVERSGRLGIGAPADMITEAYLCDTYGVRTRLVPVQGHGWLCLPLGAKDSSCAAL